MKKQSGNSKNKRKAEVIIGKPVVGIFFNGELPHKTALAWTERNEAWLVNFQKKSCFQYVRDGKFLARKVSGPIRLLVKDKPMALELMEIEAEREIDFKELRQVQGEVWDCT